MKSKNTKAINIKSSEYEKLDKKIEYLINKLGNPKKEYVLDPELSEKFSLEYLNDEVLTEIAKDILRHCNTDEDISVKAIYYKDELKKNFYENLSKTKLILPIWYTQHSTPEDILADTILNCTLFFFGQYIYIKDNPKETIKMNYALAIFMGFYEYLINSEDINARFPAEYLYYVHRKIYNTP